ncbi:DUF1772 domain-containing protein [Streptomyces sp. MST-110588]|uniref:DUF1772 domain-containing protein n=1 Tax=Streptomyces sp. MST-110588 TaxID=2833628 RepID=UPI001F5C1029|nr:DUF1772 domain-containing protein [Streptomyces sp. MST-110588]UNO40757.1 DUF1772 domain-containing protein [Streptomyces sp. MST-110588]
MTPLISIAVLVGCGVVAGVLFAVALSVVPAFLAMPPADYVRTHQLVGRHFDKVMPPLVLCSVAADIALAVQDAGTRGLYLAGALLLAGVSVVSQFGNVPINRKVKALTPTRLPDDWQDPRPRWRGLHLLRTALAVLAALANACAVVL